jgi:hypothetical protein
MFPIPLAELDRRGVTYIALEETTRKLVAGSKLSGALDPIIDIK